MASNHLILCRPLLLLPSIFPSMRVFSNKSVLRISWPKYKSFSFSISLSNEYSGLISFRMDWFDLFQGCISSPCLFNYYAEYIMQNAGLDEAQHLAHSNSSIYACQSDLDISLFLQALRRSQPAWYLLSFWLMRHWPL